MVTRSKAAAVTTTPTASLKVVRKLKAALEATEPAPAGKAERFTPPEVLALVRAHAPIVLDPCTTADNPVGAKRFFTVKEDGLKQSWSKVPGLVWCNPPFTRGELSRWVDKVISEYRGSTYGTREIMLLTPGDLGTKWARELCRAGQSIAFLHGRLAFLKPDGNYEQGAKQSSVIWYFGERAERFRRVFVESANVMPLAGVPLV